MGFLSKFTNTIKGIIPVNKVNTQTTSRPSITQPYMPTDTGAKLPIFPFPLIMIYELANNIDALRIPIDTINRETFKNGFEVVEKFKWRCNNCHKEFEYAPTKGGKGKDDSGLDEDVSVTDEKNMEKKNLECDTCGSHELVRPKPENRKKLLALIEKPVNGNEQTIKDVARQLERDLEIADSAYLLILKSYNISNETGKINHDKTTFKEIIRVDPPQLAMIADSDGRIGYDDKRNPMYICPFFEHRDKRLTEPVCRRHDKHHAIDVEAIKAIAEVSSVYSIGVPQPKRVIYGEGELIWKAGKYRPDLIYGYSPIFSIWSKALALSHMDEYIRKYFDKMRPPRGLLIVASRNYETFRKAWSQFQQEAVEDPYNIHPMMVESEKGGKNMAQWLDFTGSLKELQFIDIRKELRMIIGAIYGVLPLYFGELPTGWSQEGLQVTITNRAVKWAQDVLYEAFFLKLAKIMGVDDWDLKLKEGEETDKLRDLQIDAQEITNMATIQQMGFPVERNHQGEWKVGKKPTFEQMPPQPDAGVSGAKPGRGSSSKPNKEDQQRTQGEPKKRRPSDTGGPAQGHPASGGGNTGDKNQSRKSGKTALSEPEEDPDEIKKPHDRGTEPFGVTQQPGLIAPQPPKPKLPKPLQNKKTKYTIQRAGEPKVDIIKEEIDDDDSN